MQCQIQVLISNRTEAVLSVLVLYSFRKYSIWNTTLTFQFEYDRNCIFLELGSSLHFKQKGKEGLKLWWSLLQFTGVREDQLQSHLGSEHDVGTE